MCDVLSSIPLYSILFLFEKKKNAGLNPLNRIHDSLNNHGPHFEKHSLGQLQLRKTDEEKLRIRLTEEEARQIS